MESTYSPIIQMQEDLASGSSRHLRLLNSSPRIFTYFFGYFRKMSLMTMMASCKTYSAFVLKHSC